MQSLNCFSVVLIHLWEQPHAMKNHIQFTDARLRQEIKSRQITFAGNKCLKIYGALSCSSGKRMKKENRIFFSDELEALKAGYRPCGHCLKAKYKMWKTQQETG
jgi:methylphosphotriester-DNA--protein-cysteine methyltransferase